LLPGALTDFGLAAAIMSMVEFWRQRQPGTRFTVALPPAKASFGPLIDITIYRIVQESVSNAVRHGNPIDISVSVKALHDDGLGHDRVIVEITNDGHGMDKMAGFGFGLTGMQERVRALGGRLVLTQEPGLGLSVRATLPVPNTLALSGGA
ncbi:MAG: ATP-binding protein, partial [Methylocella sp.]